MSASKPMKKTGFRESIRNTFLKYALYPILALVVLWGAAVLLYSVLAVQQTNRLANRRTADALESQYAAYRDILRQASQDDALLGALAQGAGLAEVTRANEVLYAFNNRQAIRSIFALFDAQGRLIASNTWEPRESYTLQTRFSSYVLAPLQEQPGQVYQLTARRQTPGGRDSVYTLLSPLFLQEELRGYLLFDLLESDFARFTASSDVSYTVITDRYDNVIATNDVSILGPVSKFSPGAVQEGPVQVNDIRLYLTRGLREGCPFQVFTLSSLALQNQIFWFGLLFIPATALLLVLLMILLSRRVADKNAAHLGRLIQAVEAMRQGSPPELLAAPQEQGDEFTYLSEQYRALCLRIDQLVQANQELSDARRRTEIKQLQAQFNPHFIFNVLEAIKYQLYIHQGKATQIIDLLARLLRYSISSGGNTVTLGHDLEYIKTYLALQKIRYDDRLTYDIRIPEAFWDCRLPKLILQPLVENCIAHGYQHKDCLHITITAERRGEDLQIRVTDNGDGISPQRLAAIQAQLAGSGLETDNIGLFNSHRRLQLMYGKPHGVEIHSTPGVGTQVLLTFPAQGTPDQEEQADV